MMRTRFAVGLFVVLFVAVTGIWGGAIPIVNNSFELPAQVGAPPVSFAPTGWTTSPSGANGLLPAANTFRYIEDGTQVAYANIGWLEQILTTDIAPDTTYTLSVWVSQRVGGSFTPTIELLDGSNAVITMNVANPGGAVPNLDGQYGWVDWIGTYTSGDSVDGAALGIYLGASAQQTNFDNVTLNADPASVPEPAMFALVGVGLLGLVTRRRFAK